MMLAVCLYLLISLYLLLGFPVNEEDYWKGDDEKSISHFIYGLNYICPWSIVIRQRSKF